MKTVIPFLLLIAALLTCSCDKVPANGDLDGMWQLLSITRNGVEEDVKDKQLYMSIQLKLFQLGRYNEPQRIYGYFERKGDAMSFWQFSYPSKNETPADDNIALKPDEVAALAPWGFYSLRENFKIVKLSGAAMILQSDSATIMYRKF